MELAFTITGIMETVNRWPKTPELMFGLPWVSKRRQLGRFDSPGDNIASFLKLKPSRI